MAEVWPEVTEAVSNSHREHPRGCRRENLDRVPTHAAKLVALNSDVLVTGTTMGLKRFNRPVTFIELRIRSIEGLKSTKMPMLITSVATT